MITLILLLSYVSLYTLMGVASTQWANHDYFLDLTNSVRMQLQLIAGLLAVAMFFSNRGIGSVVLLFTLCHGYFYFPTATQSISDKSLHRSSFTVNQLNLNYYNPKIDTLFANELSPVADLTVLFEVNDTHRAKFIKLRGQHFDYGSAQIEGFPDGIGIISRYPILTRQKHTVFSDDVKGVIVELHLAVNHHLVRLFALHPPSPRNKTLWLKRNEMLEYLTFMLNKPSKFEHTLVLADFNTPPWSHHFPYQTSLNTCDDFAGYYISWQMLKLPAQINWLAGLPIDNCLISKSLTITDFNTRYQDGSDHFQLQYQVNVL